MEVNALFFDLFGTLVNWRPAIMRAFRTALGPQLSEETAFTLADAWRGAYFRAIERVRLGQEPWRPLELVHEEILPEALRGRALPAMDAAARAHLVSAWDRLEPWPDAVAGIERLRRSFLVAPVSNASFRQTIAISRHAGFTWDVILGAQVARNFKTHPSVYAESARAIGLAPGACMMVAAHNADLAAAREVGLRTAFVARPTEYGPGQQEDLIADPRCDVAAPDLLSLATQLASARHVVGNGR